MPALVSTVLFTDRLFRAPASMVPRYVRGITLRFSREAKRLAPVRSGELRKSIRAGTPRNMTRKIVVGTIAVSAPHTMYVLRGTGWPVRGHSGRIYSRRGFARAQRGLSPRKQFFDVKGRDRTTPRGKPLPGTILKVGKQRLYPPITEVTSVRGQEPNNFLERAWRATAADHKVIRGIRFPLEFR